MDRVELEQVLRHWGRVYGPEPLAEWEEDSSLGSGALTGCLIEFLRVGIVTGPEGDHLTARGKESKGGAKPMKAHPVADMVDQLCCQLYKEHMVAALALRAEYCMRGPRSEKRAWIAGIAGERITRRKYDAKLEVAKFWFNTVLKRKAA